MKVALSIPDDLFANAERLRERLGMNRSRLYASALAHYVAQHNGLDTTERLNTVYAAEQGSLDPVVHRAQRRSLQTDTR